MGSTGRIPGGGEGAKPPEAESFFSFRTIKGQENLPNHADFLLRGKLMVNLNTLDPGTLHGGG